MSDEPVPAYLVIDGFDLQVKPVLTRAQYAAIGGEKYYPYERYVSLICPTVVKQIEENKMVERATGLKTKDPTPDDWEYLKEAIEIAMKRRKNEE